jgi:hypothetical protein
MAVGRFENQNLKSIIFKKAANQDTFFKKELLMRLLSAHVRIPHHEFNKFLFGVEQVEG